MCFEHRQVFHTNVHLRYTKLNNCTLNCWLLMLHSHCYFCMMKMTHLCNFSFPITQRRFSSLWSPNCIERTNLYICGAHVTQTQTSNKALNISSECGTQLKYAELYDDLIVLNHNIRLCRRWWSAGIKGISEAFMFYNYWC